MYIDSTNVDNTDYMLGGANTILTCDTDITTQNKTVTTELPFELHNDLSFKIKFTHGNSAPIVKLQVNSTTNTTVTFTGNTNLKANVVYDCHYNGTSYVINNSAYELEGKTWRETALNGLYIGTNTSMLSSSGTYTFTPDVTPPGSVPLQEGSVVRIVFRYALATSSSDGFTSVKLNYGGHEGIIVAQRSDANNGYVNIASHVFNGGKYSGTSNNKVVWDAYTTLELMWIGSVWLVMGNPVLCSYFSSDQSYTVYANGLIEQWILTSERNADRMNFPLNFTTTNYYAIGVVYDDGGSMTDVAYIPQFAPSNYYESYVKFGGPTSLKRRVFAIGY